jgi:hypothetical protein
MGNVIYPHRIRLRGPWRCEPLQGVKPRGESSRPAGDPRGSQSLTPRLEPGDPRGSQSLTPRLEPGDPRGSQSLTPRLDGPLPPPRTVRMPCRWRDAGLADFAGRVRFSRNFGYPGQIDSWERVWLTFAGIDGHAEIALNEQLLGSASRACEFDATRLLTARNRLDVVVESSSSDAGLWGEVALEVRCTAYLQNVRASLEGGRLVISGDVAGVADQPLELYVLNDRHTLAYQEVKPGASFAVVADEFGGATPATVHVELVNVSTVWHALDLPILAQRG